jgi:hypothetical protein
MITKLAIFEGTVKPGQTAAMRAFVEAELAPLWRAFDGAHRVRVLYAAEPDDGGGAGVEGGGEGGPSVPLILQVDYQSQADLDRAMASDARHRSRAMLSAFYDRFFETVTLRHHTFEAG